MLHEVLMIPWSDGASSVKAIRGKELRTITNFAKTLNKCTLFPGPTKDAISTLSLCSDGALLHDEIYQKKIIMFAFIPTNKGLCLFLAVLATALKG
jgi:hypothetical protein